MGSWIESCVLGGPCIREGSPVEIYVIVKNKYTYLGKEANNFCSISDVFSPISVAIYGTYNDYGGIKGDPNQPGIKMLYDYLKDEMSFNGLEIDVPNFDLDKIKPMDLINKVIRDNKVKIGGEPVGIVFVNKSFKDSLGNQILNKERTYFDPETIKVPSYEINRPEFNERMKFNKDAKETFWVARADVSKIHYGLRSYLERGVLRGFFDPYDVEKEFGDLIKTCKLMEVFRRHWGPTLSGGDHVDPENYYKLGKALVSSVVEDAKRSGECWKGDEQFFIQGVVDDKVVLKDETQENTIEVDLSSFFHSYSF